MPLWKERLDNANVLVTGGSSETGPFICRAFADAGANVALTFHDNETGAAQTEAYVTNSGQRARRYRLDLLSQTSINELIERLIDDWERLDVVVLCAGSKGLRNFQNLSREQLDTAIDGNVKGNFMLAKTLGFWMKEKEGLGKIIQFTAQSAENVTHSAYGMAKAAQRDMGEFLAYHLAPEVTVNTIQPITIDQDPDSKTPPEDPAPLGRCVHARELAEMCVLLCAPAFDTVTGECIRMDSGRHVATAFPKKL